MIIAVLQRGEPMTLNGAIMQLVEMRENSMMPEVFKPYFDKVIETVSECEEPSMIPERKKGKWIRDAVWFTRYHCSQCGEKTEDTIMGEPRYKWCPMCGADMRTSEDK